jgi:hypothetical protein
VDVAETQLRDELDAAVGDEFLHQRGADIGLETVGAAALGGTREASALRGAAVRARHELEPGLRVKVALGAEALDGRRRALCRIPRLAGYLG